MKILISYCCCEVDMQMLCGNSLEYGLLYERVR
mgnify:CR=1 FL=1